MAELFSRRRANRPRTFLGRLSCFERMESGPCGLRADVRRFGGGRDPDSGGSGDRRSAPQTGIAWGEPRRFSCGAFLLMGRLSSMTVYSAQFLIGGSGAFLAPTVAAITLGIVGAGAFDKQFGKNQAFNSAGNVFTALLIAFVSYKFGYRAIFVIAALLAIPAAATLFAIDATQIDYARARGAVGEEC